MLHAGPHTPFSTPHPSTPVQVSHHIHCNDDALDEDVMNAMPFLRFDPRLPRHWYHKYQHIYMWFTFPLLQLVFQVRGAVPLHAAVRLHWCSLALVFGPLERAL